jgi:hypothetical protein
VGCFLRQRIIFQNFYLFEEISERSGCGQSCHSGPNNDGLSANVT